MNYTKKNAVWCVGTVLHCARVWYRSTLCAVFNWSLSVCWLVFSFVWKRIYYDPFQGFRLNHYLILLYSIFHQSAKNVLSKISSLLVYTLNIFVKFCLSLVPIAVVVAFGFMQFDDFCTLFLFAANACCYFGYNNLDQIEQGSGM